MVLLQLPRPQGQGQGQPQDQAQPQSQGQSQGQDQPQVLPPTQSRGQPVSAAAMLMAQANPQTTTGNHQIRHQKHSNHFPNLPPNRFPPILPPVTSQFPSQAQTQPQSQAVHEGQVQSQHQEKRQIQVGTTPQTQMGFQKSQLEAQAQAPAQSLVRVPTQVPTQAKSKRPRKETPVPPPVVPISIQAAATDENLIKMVTDYLLKKGYRRTEEIFRQEVKDIDETGKPRDQNDSSASSKFLPAGKFLSAFNHLARWIDNGIDLYKFDLGKVQWPLLVYSYLRLVSQGSTAHAQELLEKTRDRFEKIYPDEVKRLSLITLPSHAKDDPLAKAYLESQWIIPMSKSLIGHLFHFLERDWEQCGSVVLDIIQAHCRVDAVDRGPIDPFSFATIHRHARQQDQAEVDIEEGIPGLANRSGLARNTLDNTAPLKLGALPMDPELRGDVLPELEEQDKLHPPAPGAQSLVDQFNEMHPVKKETDDSPQRSDIPYPPSRARDVVMEMQKVRENRDRFRIEGRTGGLGPGVGVSVCMHTFHNHLSTISCMDFSKDQQLVAVGTTESYIRVWSLDGKELKSANPPEKGMKFNNRKLIGHSGPVYQVAFSDAIVNLDRNIYEGADQPQTDSKLLLSCSADGQVRLWSLEVWACLCIYKGHDGPVFNLAWSPHGHYFLTGGWDKTVRVWSQDHASAQRLLVGHDTSISSVTWHPNGAYVFSASDETDKSIRMWSVVNGDCVRIFNGHNEYVSALECAPNGKVLASADIGGNIILWDIEKGARIKRCRGHGRGGIWSLSFSVESSALISGGQDNTVRVWDVEMPAEGSRPAIIQDGDGITVATGGQGDGKQAGQSTQQAGGAAGGAGKRKGKEVMITPDQISAFPTKKTPVMKVQFTRMNLVIAGGCYTPETQDASR